MSGWRRFLQWLDASSSFGRSGLADETAAYLDGHLLESLRAGGAGGRVPGWMWLNGVAHGDPERIAWLASERPPSPALGWRRARARLADELLKRSGGDPKEMARLQNDVLIPLELMLSNEPDLSPGRLVDVVVAELELAQR